MQLPAGTPEVRGYLCSHPKCGRTWVRFALARYMSRVLDLGIGVDLHTLWKLLPNFDSADPEPGRDLDAYAFASRPEVPLIVSTHLPYDPGLFGRAPIVFIVRNPYDVIVSHFFHRSKAQSDYSGDLKSFVRDGSLGTPALVDYLNVWAPYLNGNGALTVSYESLQEHSRLGFRQIVERFGLSVDEAALTDALEFASIPNMRRIELDRGIVNFDYDRSDPDALRVRRAVVGGFRDYLDDDDARYVRETCTAGLSGDAWKLLDRHGVAP